MEEMELYHEEANDLVEGVSARIVWLSRALTLLVVLGLAVAAFLIRCPDAIISTIELNGLNQPIRFMAPSTGYIGNVLVKDGDYVQKDKPVLTLGSMGELAANTLESPIDGYIDFVELRGEGQYVVQGSLLFCVAPKDVGSIKGRMLLAASEISRLKVNGKCVVSLDKYPSSDNGNVVGVIEKISKIPSLGDKYMVTVGFPNGLVTTDQGKAISQESLLTGTCAAIVEDRHLIDIVLNPIRSIFSSKISSKGSNNEEGI